MKTFIPKEGHIKVLPKVITSVAKKVVREDGSEAEIVMGDRSKDEKIKAVNQGIIIKTSSANMDYCEGAEVVYYPFSANKFMEEDVEYHIIHERDVMGYLSEVS